MVRQTLGDDVDLEGQWWLGGEPWIDGAVCVLFPHHTASSLRCALD